MFPSPPTSTRACPGRWIASSSSRSSNSRSSDNVGLLQDVPTASNYGRVTKAMAYTTLAKLYINAQEWIGEAKWDETIAACDQVIGFGQLEIEPDYFSNFKVDNTSSKENIFVILYDKVYTSQKLVARLPAPPADAQQPRNRPTASSTFAGTAFAATESFYNKYDPKDIRRRQWLAGPPVRHVGQSALMQKRAAARLHAAYHLAVRLRTRQIERRRPLGQIRICERAAGRMHGQRLCGPPLCRRADDEGRGARAPGTCRPGSPPSFNEVRHRTGLDDYKASDLTPTRFTTNGAGNLHGKDYVARI